MRFQRIIIYVLLICSCWCSKVIAQPRWMIQRSIIELKPYQASTYLYEIPFKRRYFHEDKIGKELYKADVSDGLPDGKISYRKDTTLTPVITKAILEDARHVQILVENMPANGRDSFADNNERIRCLNALFNILSDFNRDKKYDPNHYSKLILNLLDMIMARNEDKLWSFCVKNCNIYTLENGKLLFDGFPECRAYVYSRMGAEQPKMMFKRLNEFAQDTFAYAIIATMAKLEPETIFTYATSNNVQINKAIHRTPDAYVKAIVNIADNASSPLKALCLLGDVYRNEKSITEIDAITDSADLFFRSLVNCRLRNDSVAKHLYSKELQLRALRYIRLMNELHESSDVVRFKCLDSISKEELYYIIVSGQEEIYTSSFLGSFKRLMEKMKPLTGYQMFEAVHFDHFRTFIKMCAGYNTLSDFLNTMPEDAKNTLMSNFIANLQQGKDDELEDAVDVADAFGSITDSVLLGFLKTKVKENYEISYKEGSKKGLIIYSLLARLFEGNQLTNNDSLANVVSEKMGLPSINKMSFSALQNDSGIVYQQVFFFGDEDGLHSYEHFTDLFRKDPKWKIVTEKYWSVIYTTSGKRVVIYANLPLPEPQDDEAINMLTKFLADTGIKPSIMIHRGHSYHLPTTLTKLAKQVKVIILGSCGGYQNLATVIEKSPDAQIVSSKQTGTMAVNDEILKSLNTSLMNGQDINWITMWRNIEDFFNKKRNPADKDKFSDYVPPHKNLGAIFIKAYKHMMATGI